MRAKEAKLALHRSPAAKSTTVGTTARPTPILVLGVTADWLRVQLPTGRTGFVPSRTVLKAEPLRREALAVATDLYALPQANAQALDSLPAKTTVAVLGEFGGYRLVQRTNGRVGWLAPKAS